jgi:uncharacterized protein YdiU (UPF0061 family)
MTNSMVTELCPWAGGKDQYAALLTEVVQRTARLVALWQCVGFVHGVGNTDNFSILGETIDYGCAGVWGTLDDAVGDPW